MTFEDIVAADEQFVVPTYGQRQLALVRGEGVEVWDVAGKRYLDFLSGLGVTL